MGFSDEFRSERDAHDWIWRTKYITRIMSIVFQLSSVIIAAGMIYSQPHYNFFFRPAGTIATAPLWIVWPSSLVWNVVNIMCILRRPEPIRAAAVVGADLMITLLMLVAVVSCFVEAAEDADTLKNPITSQTATSGGYWSAGQINTIVGHYHRRMVGAG